MKRERETWSHSPDPWKSSSRNSSMYWKSSSLVVWVGGALGAGGSSLLAESSTELHATRHKNIDQHIPPTTSVYTLHTHVELTTVVVHCLPYRPPLPVEKGRKGVTTLVSIFPAAYPGPVGVGLVVCSGDDHISLMPVLSLIETSNVFPCIS